MIHKCDGCEYKGEFYDVKFRPQHVCYRARNQVEAVKAFEAKECPFKGMKDKNVSAKDGGAGK